MAKVAIVCNLCLLTSAAAPQRLEEGNSFPWPSDQAAAVKANALPLATVESWLNTLVQPAQIGPIKVQEFRFAKLEERKWNLVATIDTSGRGLFFAAIVVSPEGSVPRYQIVEAAPPHLLAAELLDLDGKGIDTLITKQLVGLYEGTASAPLFWYSLYQMNGGKLTDVSARHPEFYRNVVLPNASFIGGALASAGSKEKSKTELYVAKSAYLEFKYQRVIEGKLSSGLEAAMQWKESPDPKVRLLAVETFADIDLPGSITSLDEMSHGSDLVTSEAAKAALARKKK